MDLDIKNGKFIKSELLKEKSPNKAQVPVVLHGENVVFESLVCVGESLRFCVYFLQTALTPSCALTRIIENVQNTLMKHSETAPWYRGRRPNEPRPGYGR